LYRNEAPGIIVRIAEEIRITPVLVARFILEAYLKEKILKETSTESETLEPSDKLLDPGKDQMSWMCLKQEISKLLKNTCLIEDKDLAYEVHLVIIAIAVLF